MRKMNFTIKSEADLIKAVTKYGFLPYFRNSIEGFSIEEHIEPRYWFSDEDGAWEWKGSVIQKTGCAYGKFFERKAVYISKEWFPDFANYRRDVYQREPEESYQLIFEHLRKILPQASEEQIRKLLK